MTNLVSMVLVMTQQSNRRALVVGMGISGIATATRLHAAGWTPVIVERSPQRRRGGYFIALFGAGKIAAQRLGMMDHLHDRKSKAGGYALDRRGNKRPSMTYGDVPGSPWLMLRGDVEAAAYAGLPSDLEIRFGTVPTAITQDADGVDVTLLDTAAQMSTTERFDLVVGSDGLRSTVRALTFGPHEDYLQRLNHMIVAFEYPGTALPGLKPGEAAMLHEVGRSMMVFAFEDHGPSILLTYRTDDVDAEFTQTPGQRLRAVFGPKNLGTTLSAVIDAVDTAEAVLFDSAEQVHLDTWSQGRVVLVGDSAWCTTLYAGMGVSAGLVGADLLGSMLERHPDDVPAALRDWEKNLRPYVDEYQKMGHVQRRFFVQDTRLEMLIQKALPKLMKNPLGERLFGRFKPNRGGATDADIVGITTDQSAPALV
ncbi:FAD-dependent monooxygenase [soil metagenome]